VWAAASGVGGDGKDKEEELQPKLIIWIWRRVQHGSYTLGRSCWLKQHCLAAGCLQACSKLPQTSCNKLQAAKRKDL
jgi:hypothetical protein